MAKIDELVDAYVRLRDRKAQLKKNLDITLEPINSKMTEIEGMLGAELNKSGLESMKTKAGTAYKQSFMSATVEDWAETLDFIVANDQLDLLERRVNKTAVQELLDENVNVPGVKVSRGIRINIRKS